MFYMSSSLVTTFTLLIPIYHFFPAENLAESFFFSFCQEMFANVPSFQGSLRFRGLLFRLVSCSQGPTLISRHRAPRITETERLQQILYSASSLGTVSPAWLCPSPRSTGRECDVPAANTSALAWISAFSLSSSFKPQFPTVSKRSDLALR